MVAYTLVQRLTPNLALTGAGLAGVLVALATLAIPGSLLEDMVVTSGIAAFIPAAEPPLGVTARIYMGVFAGGAAALIAWFLLSALLVWRDSRSELEEEGVRAPVVRRADAHPDAPPRPPLLATRDLGMPVERGGHPVEAQHVEADVQDLDLPELPAEPVIAMGTIAPSIIARSVAPPAPQPLPADLDQPLSAFDPGAILEHPLAPPPPLKPLHHAPPPVFSEGERFETFELTPAVRPAPVAPMAPPRADNLAAPETEASVHALLDRLERGIARRGEQAQPPATQTASAPPAGPSPEPEAQGLEGALEALRKLAVRV